MVLDPWLPIGQILPDGARTRHVLSGGPDWQAVDIGDGGVALLTRRALEQRWTASALIQPGQLSKLSFGNSTIFCLTSHKNHRLSPVGEGASPRTKAEALAFSAALRATRAIDGSSPMQDAIYVEKISRLLPTYTITPRLDDDVVLGMWLTGGVRVSVRSTRRFQQLTSWMAPSDCAEVVAAAGLVPLPDRGASSSSSEDAIGDTGRKVAPSPMESGGQFKLRGRPTLEAFFNEHVIDIMRHRERYRALGITFPSALVLHGPPGCGKTFAIEKVVEFLGWPSFQIDASSVASPYIHETSRKVADIFDRAMKHAPSVLIIDEMEAFLADREMGTGHYRVEEMAEFLRRIPEAVQNDVWVVAMTNRIEMIDPAILRRGRFDHVLQVGYATEAEIEDLLKTLLSTVPTEPDVVPGIYAKQLAGRPLSDVAFIVREGARLAARSGKQRLDHGALMEAMSSAMARGQAAPRRQIGFSERS